MKTFEPKTWGFWSARLALAVAALFLALNLAGWFSDAGACSNDPAGCASSAAISIAIAGLLALGAARTLFRKSGGLRLLAGAWGVALGAGLGPHLMAPAAVLHDASSIVLSPTGAVLLAGGAAGLALTVLHKEK